MNVYYKRIKVFMKYPFRNEVDEDRIHFSKSKTRFKSFAECLPSKNMKKRELLVKEQLGVKKVKLVKA